MRLRIFIIMFFLGGVALATTPKDVNPSQLHFGIDEFTQALSYYSKDFTTPKTEEVLSKNLMHLQKRHLKYKNESSFVEYAFYYIHNRLLKEYKEYASLDQTLQKGTYDCVTATAMYALFFSELEVPYSVVETNYHLYILAFPGTGNEVLIETTDPLNGFITKKEEVSARKELYVKGNGELRANQADLKWNVEHNLKDSELIGLLLFNQSVKHYNLGNKTKALELANEALTYYPSSRIRTYLQFLKGNSLALR
ncbi:MAG: hypothetical protein KDC79_01990 [Cyclobacteriaceae bacterium]|nr:hypothetical protein [Cyclobacteriaceae bacterium]